nr:putative integron gene cassette protein [uncultured bacterium]
MVGGWLLEVLISTGKVVVPAILIALIAQSVILRWQHGYWRLQKITALQDETYREAKRVLVPMTYFAESLAQELAGPPSEDTADAEKGSSSPDLAEAISRVFAEALTDRVALASLSSDVHRWFSPKAYSAIADAVMEVLQLQSAIAGCAESSEAGAVTLTPDLQLRRSCCIFKVRRALDLLAKEIGREPRPWYRLRRSEARFGRRRDDLQAELLQMIPAGSIVPKEGSGHCRRYTDKKFAEIARMKGIASAEQDGNSETQGGNV